MILARQSTARTVTVGPVLDEDGVAVTGAVVGNFKIAKNGGAPAALNGSATLTHRNTGHYSLALTASDLDTVGQAEIVIDDTTNACAVKEISVIEEAAYDALFAASAPGYVANAPVNVAQISGDSAAADNAEAFFDGTGYAGTNNVIPTVTTLTNAPSDSSGTTTLLSRLTSTRAGYLDNLSGGAVALASGVTVTTNNDKTGYSLSQSFPSNFASLAITAAGKVTVGTNDDKTGYSLTQSFPSNFASLGINASGHVSRVTLADTVTTLAGHTAQTGDSYAVVSSGTHGNAALKTLVDGKPTLAQILAGGDVDGYTLEETLKLCLAALAGKLSGAATTTVTIRAADDSANRLVATVDSDGNRSAVTLNAAG